MRKLDVLVCEACGATLTGKPVRGVVTCEYCGTRYMVDEPDVQAPKSWDEDEDESWEDESARDVKSSSEIAAYARSACEKFLRKGDAKEFQSTRKIEMGLSVDPAAEEIFLIHDDTIFKSGKNGFAITSQGLYCREMGDAQSHFTDWETFARGGKPHREESYIYSDNTSIAYLSGNDHLKERLLDLLVDIHKHA